MKRLLAILMAVAMLIGVAGTALADVDSYTDLAYAQTAYGPIVGYTYNGGNTFRNFTLDLTGSAERPHGH